MASSVTHSKYLHVTMQMLSKSTVATNYYATRNSKTVTLAGGGSGSSNTETQFVVGDRLLL